MKTKWFVPTLTIAASFATMQCGHEKKAENSADSQATLEERWDAENDPKRLGLDGSPYVMDFGKLPLEGTIPFIPWSGSYWPSMKGGGAFRWNYHNRHSADRIYYDLIPFENLSSVNISELSPTEKLDIFLNDRNYSFTNAERKRTNIMNQQNGVKIPYWFGLCHAWAPATLFYPNPGPVTLKNSEGVSVPFGSSDIKALLSMYLNDVKSPSYRVSLRCNTDDKELRRKLESNEISLAEYNKAMDSADCQGINPGAFHVLLGNMIGIRREGFIADVTRGAEVWNQSVSGYKTRVVRTRTDISSQAAQGTKEEVLLETVMIYTQEITDTWDRVQIPESNKDVVYRYWLELDSARQIIGGSWVSDQRPDFLWRRERPSPEFAGKWAPLKQILEAATKDVVTGSSSNGVVSSGSDHGSEYLVQAPKWHITKFMFTYLVDVELTAQPGISKVKMEIVKNDGKTHKVKHLKRRGTTFRLRNYPVAQWKAGSLKLSGLDTKGKQLFSMFHTFTN